MHNRHLDDIRYPHQYYGYVEKYIGVRNIGTTLQNFKKFREDGRKNKI